jgi:MtN3 and saliva related transmembrane protein
MNNIELIGFIAGVFVAASLFPQVIKSWKTKSTRDISISWSIINLMGQILWLVYGVFINSVSLITMTALTFFMMLSIVILKLRFG